MAISVIFSGNPMVGTAGDDFIVADQNATVETNNTINAGDGDDLVIADAGHTHFLNSAVQNWSIETAYNLDDVTTWSTTENELLGNSALPHTTVITEATIGQPEYYSVTVGAGKQLIVDIDFGDNTPIGIPTNLALAIRDSSGNFLAGSDNSFTTDGGLGSFQINVPIVSLNSNDPYGGYTPTNAGLYYISVNSTVGTTTFTANNTFVMNVSVAGHAVGTNPVQGNDVINGGNGDDSLFGMGGADTINGGPGNDLISGGTGNNTVHGDDGDDVLVSSGEGLYFGDGGNDMVIAATTPGETLDGGPGSDTLDLTKWIFGDLTFDLGAGFTNSGQSYTNFENIITGEGNDKITGTSGANNISTKGGNDTVLAGAGNDTISGGFGNQCRPGARMTFHAFQIAAAVPMIAATRIS